MRFFLSCSASSKENRVVGSGGSARFTTIVSTRPRSLPGLGLRITVPAMGPAPIALDFAYALNRADFDDREVFSFSLGFSR